MEDIKYYSGTVGYSFTFIISKDFFENDKKLILDLCNVSLAAKIFENDVELGVL